MRAILGVLLSITLIAPGAGRHHQARPHDHAARQALAAIYARFDRAAEAKDSGPLRQLILKETTPNGVVQRPGFRDTRQEWIQRVKASQAHWQRARSARTTIDHLTVQGKEATALVTGHMTIVSTDPMFTHDLTRKPHTFVSIFTNRDVWSKTPQGWKRTRTQNLTLKRTMDGKLVVQLPRPGAAKAVGAHNH